MPSQDAPRRKTVLVIDDGPVARADLQGRLKANDYAVVFAADATSAVTAANRERPDLILLDLGLPGEMASSSCNASAALFAAIRAALGDEPATP